MVHPQNCLTMFANWHLANIHFFEKLTKIDGYRRLESLNVMHMLYIIAKTRQDIILVGQ
jgi:hypothetical protein